MVKGVELGMVPGQAPVSLVSANVQLVMTSALVSSTGNLNLAVSATAAQSAYGAIQPKITLGVAGLAGCTFPGGYAQLSVLQWGNNPFSGSTGVKSPLLRFSSSQKSTTTTVSAASLRSQVSQNSTTFLLPGVPAYTIALQFSAFQNFSFSASNQISSKSNFTLPACTLYNGAAYVPCNGCNVSSYTNYNVTYSCFDVTQLCQTTSIGRNLQEIGEDYTDIEYNSHSRGLATNSDAQTSDALTYGVVISSIIYEFTTVLSNNPFLLNPALSKGVLIFMGCLAGSMILILYYLLRYDYHENMQTKYTKGEGDAIARKKLEEYSELLTKFNSWVDAVVERKNGFYFIKDTKIIY